MSNAFVITCVVLFLILVGVGLGKLLVLFIEWFFNRDPDNS